MTGRLSCTIYDNEMAKLFIDFCQRHAKSCKICYPPHDGDHGTEVTLELELERPRKRRNKEETEEFRERVWQMLRDGYSKTEIAARFGCTLAYISKLT